MGINPPRSAQTTHQRMGQDIKMSEKMKCPECGKWSDVIETRLKRGTEIIYRRRECGNGHRFVTHEKFFSMVKKRNAQDTHTSDTGSAKKNP